MVDSSFIQILFIFFIEELCDFPPVHTDEAPYLPYLLLVYFDCVVCNVGSGWTGIECV